MPRREPLPTIRVGVLLLGEAAAGKTALIRRLRWQQCQSVASEAHRAPQFAFTAAYDPTVGVELHHNTPHCPAALSACPHLWRLEDGRIVRVVCSVYDLSGGAGFAKVRSEFYAHYQAVVFAFDATSRASFDALNAWYSEAVRLTQDKQLSNPNAHPFQTIRGALVATKVDAAAGARVVSDADARAWASDHQLSYFECSAKTGLNVKELFDAVVLIAANATATVPNTAASPYADSKQFASDVAAGAGAEKAAEKMSAAELKKALAGMGVDTRDVLEKKELVARYALAMRGGGKYSARPVGAAAAASAAPAPTAAATAAAAAAAKNDSGLTAAQQKIVEQITNELELFSAGKDLRALLNAVNGSGADELKANATHDAVQKSYRKALLKVHPDKTPRSDFAAHFRATELFKIVNEKWQAYSSQHKAAGPLSPTAATSAAATPKSTAAAAAKPKGSFGFGGGKAGGFSTASAGRWA